MKKLLLIGLISVLASADVVFLKLQEVAKDKCVYTIYNVPFQGCYIVKKKKK